jgi:Flp pilus assembly protein TadG
VHTEDRAIAGDQDMRCRKGNARPGATLVETALVGLVFLMVILGTLDLGIAVLRYNVSSQAAAQGARIASVHGSLANGFLGSWGPATYGPAAGTDSNPIAQAIAPYLTGADPTAVTIKVEWLDGDNNTGHRVRVTVTDTYHPITTFIFGNPTFNFSAVSIMTITN